MVLIVTGSCGYNWNAAWSNALQILSCVFGDAALELLGIVEKLVAELPNERSEFADSDFKNLADSINRERNDPIISHLKGLSFQALTGLLLKEDGFQNLAINIDAPYEQHGQSTTRDIDVSGFRGNILRLVECKAELKDKPLDKAHIQKFYTETVPAALKFFRSKSEPFNICEAEIWTTGSVDEVALNELGRIKLKSNIKIASAFVESAINQVVSKRMVKKQQMGWSQRGAHLLLQIRTRVLDEESENTFRRWYPDFRPQGQAKKAA